MLREKSNDTNKVQPRILARLPYKNSYKIINEFCNWFLKMKFKFRSGCERQNVVLFTGGLTRRKKRD